MNHDEAPIRNAPGSSRDQRMHNCTGIKSYVYKCF